MCTLIALWQIHPSAPLVLALNRDEFLGRPTKNLMLWDDLPPAERIVGGRDLRSGGTWFGVGKAVVAALTNQKRPMTEAEALRAGATPSQRPRSRGELVLKSAQATLAGAGMRELAALPASDFDPFHLLACDGEEMFWLTNREGEMELTEVKPGVHVLGNDGLDNEADPVVRALHSDLADAHRWAEDELLENLRDILASHGTGRPCVHYNDLYGTRSSAILIWGNRRPHDEARSGASGEASGDRSASRGPRIWTTDGPPCQNAWTDQSDLLAELQQ